MSRLLRLYVMEALAAISGTLVTVGLPFFTHHRFGWDARDNLMLAAGQGVVYVVGALLAQPLSRRFGRRAALIGLYSLLIALGAGLAVAGAWGAQAALVALVLLEMTVIAATWPMVESLVSSGADPKELSRRLGIYNINWATTGALALAACGAVIQHAAVWVFFAIAAAGHAASLILAISNRGMASVEPGPPTPTSTPPTSPTIEVALLQQRRLALWLSRIALPATYVVAYSLSPLLPSLPAVKQLSPTMATLLASVWLVARAVMFVITRHTKFWHVRPGLLLWASVIMLLAFVGTVVPPSLPGLGFVAAITAMVIAELVLGLALGMIYTSSLYFGMVLSEGSTEHGGYHEALIGLGQTLGPGVGAMVLWMRPGDIFVGVATVSAMVSVSIVVAAVFRVRIGRETRALPG